jgi:hypothetical protein
MDIDFRLPISENTNAIDYVLPDYNEIKQGYVQPLSSIGNNADNSKKSAAKQQV